MGAPQTQRVLDFAPSTRRQDFLVHMPLLPGGVAEEEEEFGAGPEMWIGGRHPLSTKVTSGSGMKQADRSTSVEDCEV